MGLNLKHLASNSLYTVSRQALSAILVLGISVLLANLLGPEEFGLYSLAILLPLMVTQFTNLGIRQSVTYHIGRRDYPLPQIIGTSLIFVFIVSVLATAGAAGLIIWAREILFPNISQTILVGVLLAIPFLLIAHCAQGIFVGLQDFKIYNLLTLLPDLSFLLLILLLTILSDISLVTTIIAYVLSRFIMLPIAHNKLLKKRNIAIDWRLNLTYLRQSLFYGTKIYLGNITAFINYRLDQFLVVFFLGPVQLGIYAVAVTLSEGLSLLSGGISTVLLPRIVALEDSPTVQQETTSLVTRHMVIISALISVVLFFSSDLIVKTLYPEDLQSASLVLKLLLPGIFATSVARILATDVAARGYPELNLYGGTIGIITNLVLNLILIPRLGIAGAAIATSISYSLNSLLKMIIYLRLSKVGIYKVLLIQSSDFVIYKQLILNLSAQRLLGRKS